jgi:hypothetical protein
MTCDVSPPPPAAFPRGPWPADLKITSGGQVSYRTLHTPGRLRELSASGKATVEYAAGPVLPGGAARLRRFALTYNWDTCWVPWPGDGGELIVTHPHDPLIRAVQAWQGGRKLTARDGYRQTLKESRALIARHMGHLPGQPAAVTPARMTAARCAAAPRPEDGRTRLEADPAADRVFHAAGSRSQPACGTRHRPGGPGGARPAR